VCQEATARGAISRTDPLTSAVAKTLANDPNAAMAAVTAGLSNLASAFGGPFIPQITGGLSSLANALNWTVSLTKPHLGPDGTPEMLDNPESSLDAAKDWWNAAKKWWNGPGPDARGPSHLSVFDSPGADAAPQVKATAPPPGERPQYPMRDPLLPEPPRTYDPLSSIHAPQAALASPPVNVNASMTFAGQAQAVFSGVTVNVEGLGAALDAKISAAMGKLVGSLGGMFKTSANNSPSSFDGRAAPASPDSSIIGHH
jgi:hypothetical protein